MPTTATDAPTTAAPVTVYSSNTCPWCDRTKEFLTARNVPFVEKDVSSDYAAAMEMVRRTGQQGVPVVATDDEVIVGFDQVRLAKLAEKHAGPRRPPLGLLAADAEQYFARHPEAAAAAPGGSTGVYVGEVRPGTVADAAALRRGDVIVALAGKRVRNMAMLDRLVEAVRPGEQVGVRFYRSGQDQTATLQF